MDTPLNNLSLCSGGGGLDLGLRLAVPNVRTVCWCEWEGFAVDWLATRMEAGLVCAAPVWTNLKTFDGRPWRGVVDCLTAGYPCQPFSCAGGRRGSDDPRHLWPHVRRIVGEVEPRFCFFENVGGHLSLGAEEVFGDLQRLGYRVAAGLFTAEEVGATHRRERLFILAVADAQHAQRGRSQSRAGSVERTALAGAGGATLSELADASHERFSLGQRQRGDAVQEQPTAVRGGGELPLFPPGPEELDRWRDVLEASPHLRPATQPGVCELVDGMAADRSRWLRLLGNGVVPLQAAYAFASLWAALRLGSDP